ncbi:hypothetical protein HID58_036799, partial [Brassica napus]
PNTRSKCCNGTKLEKQSYKIDRETETDVIDLEIKFNVVIPTFHLPPNLFLHHHSISATFFVTKEQEDSTIERLRRRRKPQHWWFGGGRVVLELSRCFSTAEKEETERLTMEIGGPTNIQHVAHVTFDRFNGFLGLPSEFEPDLSYDSRGNCVPVILLLLQSRLYDQGGLQVEGIFRITGENSEEEYVREQLNKGLIPDGIDVHCLAGLIKAWFRELPRGVLDPLPAGQVMQCESDDDFVKVVRLLPQTEASLLNWAINLMADVVQFEHVNKMNSRNLALVFAPNMSKMADPLTALMYAVQVMKLLKSLTEKILGERGATSSHVDKRCSNEAEEGEKEEKDGVYIIEKEAPEIIRVVRVNIQEAKKTYGSKEPRRECNISQVESQLQKPDHVRLLIEQYFIPVHEQYLISSNQNPNIMSQNGKLIPPNMDQSSTRLLNLTVLQRIDPFIEEILITAAHVTFYEFNIEISQWSRKDVEGSLFVVKRLISAYSKANQKPNTSSSKSEFRELEAVPTMAAMDGPLEPSLTARDAPNDPAFVNFFSSAMTLGNGSASGPTYQSSATPLQPHQPTIASPAPLQSSSPIMSHFENNPDLISSNNSNVHTDLVTPSSFFAPPRTMTQPHLIPGSSIPTAPPQNFNDASHHQRQHGTPMLQPFPPPTPPPSLAPSYSVPVINRDKVKEALLKLVQENEFIDMVTRALQNAHQQ